MVTNLLLSFYCSIWHCFGTVNISILLTIFVPGGAICPPLSYFNIAPKLNKSFALMHPDFESNLIAHIFKKVWVSRTTRSDVINAFVRGT